MAAHAAGAADTVVITALRHPVDKSYRKRVQGMDLFAEMHALAPRAELRYKVLPRRHGTDVRDVALQLVGDTVKQPVTLGLTARSRSAVMPRRSPRTRW